jgi:hypothetical protein
MVAYIVWYIIVHVGDFILSLLRLFSGFFFVHLSTDSFIPGAKGGTSIFSDYCIFCCSFHRFCMNSHKSLILFYGFVLYNSYKKCMNWYKNYTVYEFVLYNLYNNCMNLFVWIHTKNSEKKLHRFIRIRISNSYKTVRSAKSSKSKKMDSPLCPGMWDHVQLCTKKL